jgi:hypothetical protein
MNKAVTINNDQLDADQIGGADEMAGIVDVLCRCNFHPNKSVVRRADFVPVGGLWKGERSLKKADKTLKNARPCTGGKLVETYWITRPEREARCDCAACAWDFRKEVFDGAALGELSAQIDATIRLAQRSNIQVAGIFAGGAHRGQAAFQLWETPQLDELAYFLIPASTYYHSVLGAPHVSIADAYIRLASWQPHLPGLIRDGDTPIIAALRIAFLIRRCDGLQYTKTWDAEQQCWRNEALPSEHPNLFVAGDECRPILDVLRAFHRDRKVLTRKAPNKFRRITHDDRAAAYAVITHATLVSLGAVQDKARWRQDTYTGDRTIIGLMLDEGRSAVDIADDLGISASMVSRRFNAAIQAISDSVGPVPALSSNFPLFVPRVGKIEARKDSPQLRIGPARPRQESENKFRYVDMPMAVYDLPSQWEKANEGAGPSMWKPGAPKVWGSGSLSRHVKLVPMDTLWTIAGYLAKSKIKHLPPGCCEGYPPEKARRFDYVKYKRDEDGEPVDGDGDFGNSAGLRVPHWFNTRQRAVDWRRIARRLPADLRCAALEQEAYINSLPNDAHDPCRVTGKIEGRFSTPYHNYRQDYYPRESKDGSTCYGDVVVWLNEYGKPVTEPASKRRSRQSTKQPKPVELRAVDRVFDDLHVPE